MAEPRVTRTDLSRAVDEIFADALTSPDPVKRLAAERALSRPAKMSVDEAAVGNGAAMRCAVKAESGHTQYGLIRLYRLRSDAVKRLGAQPRFKGMGLTRIAQVIAQEWRIADDRLDQGNPLGLPVDEAYEDLHQAQIRPVSASTIARDLDKRPDEFF